MARKKIIVDMDGALCDFVASFKKAVHSVGYTFDLNLSKSYDLKKAINTTVADAQRVITEIFMQDSFWRGLPVFDPSMVQVFERLCKNYDVWIITAPYRLKENCRELKTEWIKRNLPFFPVAKILFSEKKWLVPADCIIEDSPEQLLHFKGVTVCMDAPYNQDVDTAYRVRCWEEIEKLLIHDRVLDKKHKEKGVKFNHGKTQWALVDFESLEPMVEVLMHGAKKYSPDNWKNVNPRDYVDSLLRHVTELSDSIKKRDGGTKDSPIIDKDSGLRLIGHIMCNALFLAWFEREEKI